MPKIIKEILHNLEMEFQESILVYLYPFTKLNLQLLMMKTLFLALFILIFFACNREEKEFPELIFHNATVWTSDPVNKEVDAFAIKEGRFIAIGTDDEILQLKGPNTQVIDARDHFITPGFIDCHVHFMSGGYNLSSVQLRDASSREEFINRIKEYALTLDSGVWVMGGDWDHTLWGGDLPQRSWIDSVTSNNPVFINRLDGHMALANSLAINKANVSIETPQISGGEIVKDGNGKIMGVFKDNAMNLIYGVIDPPTEEERRKYLHNAMQYMASNGVTSVHDMGSWDDQEFYEIAREEDILTTRIYSVVPLPTWEQLEIKVENQGSGDEILRIGGLKGFVDGSLGSHTAAFFQDFDDKPGDKGFFINTAEDLYEWINNADKANLHVVVHAIGDSANSTLLNIYEDVEMENGQKDRRFRIEHAQHLNSELYARFSEIGVVPSMQPYHAIDDGRWAEEIIGDRISGTYAFKSLIDQDAKLAFGSDWFVAPATPLEGIYAAVTRRTLDDANPEGWVPEQKITVEEALIAYTINGAYASFEEGIKGSISIGKVADFVIIDKDIRNIDPVQIRNAAVLSTYFEGEQIYQRVD